MKQKSRWIFVLLFLFVVISDCMLFDYVSHRKDTLSYDALKPVRQDMVYFPIPESAYDAKGYQVTYADSWQVARNYGGERVHEGCDLMALTDKRGHYPVVSISDGVVEKIGWLKLGGYRIGIRSPHGVYFYYAHLCDYAREFAVGEEIVAGELLGFMGDTGYGETEGTTGMFPVHLHLGIYLDDTNGEEKSQNPFPILQELETKKLKFYYE